MARQEEAIADHDFDLIEKGSRRANPLDLHVGSRVRLQRMLLGMSQEKLGERLGVSVQFFYDDAPGDYSDNKASATMAGFSERSADRFVVDFLSSREGVELNKAFVKITDPKVRRTIVDLVRTLAGEEKGD